ncbi:MAG: hypothetical protein FD123_468 [Bacteroidetes bacterium]|nr:MAG: hypothetical protein FD123_468 [Bacteroidota bacterium]
MQNGVYEMQEPAAGCAFTGSKPVVEPVTICDQFIVKCRCEKD